MKQPHVRRIDLEQFLLREIASTDLTKHGRLQKKAAKRLVIDLFERIAAHVHAGREVHLPGFGVFYEKTLAAKEVTTFGKKYQTHATRSVGFRAARWQRVKL